ncbi:hypothetical protein CQW23_06280 [Capsicum baccatum]|uniref:Protein kinase domain-containing protein n=1 Tax=Capsicum baccatum TaxID=33114 RepID=A0A2G2X2V0_CAPBA|nr:hypothetical protein CQW23_06280 [Capsicum baccatum]
MFSCDAKPFPKIQLLPERDCSTSNNFLNITPNKNDHFSGYNLYNGYEGFSLYYKLFHDDKYIKAHNLPTNCSLIKLSIHASDGDLFNRFWGSKVEDLQKFEAFLENYGSYAPKRYNYADIKSIMGRFKSKLGHKGFGNAYKGSLTNGSQVAVKVLNELKGSGEYFINEVKSLPLKGLIPTSPLKGLIPTSKHSL